MIQQREHAYTGRLANRFFQNMAVHFVAKKYDILATYISDGSFNELGMEFYKEGKVHTYPTSIRMDETTCMDILNSDTKKCNIEYIFGYYQTKEFCLFLQKNMDWERILQHNRYKKRYNTNNDVFVHVRLGDTVQWNPGFQYYDSVLSTLTFRTGFITSDSPNHPIVTRLVQKYNMLLFNKGEIDTIMFGSTCKHLVLSNGTFSWLIGFLGIYSSVYFPKMKHMWHGDIFVFPEWKEVSI
jgi:hypothetical protein